MNRHALPVIAEIAQAAGFSDNAHFSRTFRRFYGQSPNDFRTGRINGDGDAGLLV